VKPWKNWIWDLRSLYFISREGEDGKAIEDLF